MLATARDSLCQFWNDSNKNLAVPMNCTTVTADPPCEGPVNA